MVPYVGFFMAGVATLISGIPNMATDGKLKPDLLPEWMYSMKRWQLGLLNIVAIFPMISVVIAHGIFSPAAATVLMGVLFGAIPALVWLMDEPIPGQ